MTHARLLLDLLSDGEPHSHHETYRLGIMAHSRAADLRKQGHDVRVWREGGSYWYQLVVAPTAGNSPQSPAVGGASPVDPSGAPVDRTGPSPRVGDGAAASPTQLSLEIPSRYKRESEAA